MTEDQAAREEAFRQRQLERNHIAGPPWLRWVVLGLVAVVLVVVGVVSLVDYLGKDERSTDLIADRIDDWARDNGADTTTKVTCPDPVEWRVGETFHCVLTIRKQSARVEVTMENDAGDVTWQVQ